MAPPAAAPVPDREHLPRSLKVAFGAPAFAGAAMAIPIAVLMPRFYSDVILVPLGSIAIAIAVARSLDALTDPAMGWISDRTRTRWGRRKPFIAVGAPLAALAFFALFAPPAGLTPAQAAWWFGASFALFFLFDTVSGIPYAALGAELTPSYRERSSLFGYRSVFIAAGTIVASLLPTVLGRVLGLADERLVYRSMAGLYAGLLVVLGAILLLRVPERPEFARRPSNPLVPGVRRALRNRPFRILLLAGVVKAIPAAIPAILMPYFVHYVLQPAEPTPWVGIYLVIYLGTGLLCVPIWMAVARRVGKLAALVWASAIGIAGSLFFFFAGPGDLFFAGCIYFVTGMVSMAGTFLVPAMAADVIDYDELRTGKRREAQYTAFWALIPKFVAIPGSSVPLAVLAGVGYVPNAVQSETVTFAIRFLYSLFPAVFYLGALLIVSRYPITERTHEAIRSGIGAHAAGAPALDPLTGAELPPPAAAARDAESWFLDHFSAGELASALASGPGRLMRKVKAAAGLSLALWIGCCAAALVPSGSASSRPVLLTVLALVAAGLAFTALLFHALRLGPALRMARAPLPQAVLRAHLLAIAADAEGSESRIPGPGARAAAPDSGSPGRGGSAP